MSRPSKYKSDYCELAKKLIKLGATDRQIADVIGVTEQTINNWKIDFPEFFESLKLAKEECDSQVEKSLYQRAMGYSHPEVKVFNNNGEIVTHEVMKHYPPDPTSMIFWLKNRQPNQWRDRIEHTGKDGEAIQIENMSDLELARKVGFILESGAQECQKH